LPRQGTFGYFWLINLRRKWFILLPLRAPEPNLSWPHSLARNRSLDLPTTALSRSFLISWPFCMTKRTRSSLPMSASGSPATATRSANLPCGPQKFGLWILRGAVSWVWHYRRVLSGVSKGAHNAAHMRVEPCTGVFLCRFSDCGGQFCLAVLRSTRRSGPCVRQEMRTEGAGTLATARAD